MTITTANKVADYFLLKAKEKGDLITNLKIQKLVYYAQGWYLAFYNEPLFDEPLEAWVHGPVQRDLYYRFREYGWENIGEITDDPELPEKLTEFLDEVYRVYGKYEGWELEYLTHRDTPWEKAREGIPDGRSSTEVISLDVMAEYFSELAEEE